MRNIVRNIVHNIVSGLLDGVMIWWKRACLWSVLTSRVRGPCEPAFRPTSDHPVLGAFYLYSLRQCTSAS